jgi:hypothetical protein
VQRNPSTTVFVTLLVALGASLGVVVWNHKSVPIIPKSVAVLPFEDLSDDPDNSYFAEGIQEEILTRLVKIGDLKVISRSSTQKYKSAPDDLPEVGKQLGVAHVLEGSVQKVARYLPNCGPHTCALPKSPIQVREMSSVFHPLA